MGCKQWNSFKGINPALLMAFFRVEQKFYEEEYISRRNTFSDS